MNTLSEVLKNADESGSDYRFGCQVQLCNTRMTKSQKPYYELQIVDSAENASLKIWNNHPQFEEVSALTPGTFLLIEGTFTKNQYGLDSPNWRWSNLPEDELETLLSGDPSLKAKQAEDYQTITDAIADLSDPRLKALAEKFLTDFGSRFQRAAAARKNHHARRGGLIEHVAQMTKTALAIASAYPVLNKDLLVTAVLFHDSGKLWENNYPENGFNQSFSLHAEALGHISLGIELVNKLWRELMDSPEKESWEEQKPATEKVRIHLLHLIASHHGALEYGSPVLPKTPEAFALHYIDNLDAKIEMCQAAYETSPLLSSEIYERKFPLPTNLINPLPPHEDDS